MKIKTIPIIRPGSHLSVEVSSEDSPEPKIQDAKMKVTSARGFELLAIGKKPEDLPLIVSRICGNHGLSLMICAASALENAVAIEIPANARILRNILQGLDFLQSHIHTFFHHILPDYIDLSKISAYNGKDPSLLDYKKKLEELGQAQDLQPFEIYTEEDRVDDNTTVLTLIKHYFEAYDIQVEIHKAIAAIAGRMPMPSSIISGGVTTNVNIDLIRSLIFITRRLIKWINNVFLADILALAPLFLPFGKMGISTNFISCGGMILNELGAEKFFERGIIVDSDLTTILNLERNEIRENVFSSWYEDNVEFRHPISGLTKFDLSKKEAYSFCKNVTYRNRIMESGPLARMLIKQDSTLLKLAKDLNIGPSVLARIAAYGIETKMLADSILNWIIELKPDKPTLKLKSTPPFAEGFSMHETPDGSTGMWVKIERGLISHFQIIAGSTWNLSPATKESKGVIEKALVGINDNDTLNLLRIVRSFQPCPMCSAH